MKKLFIIPILCMCIFLSACAGQNTSPPQSNANVATGEKLQIPPMEDAPALYVEVRNRTQAQGGLEGTIFALMQSEYGAYAADTVRDADYSIYVTLEKFGMLGSEEQSGSAGSMVIPGLVGVGVGSQVGGAVGGGSGAWIGAGLGLVAGLALGSNMNSQEVLVWHMDALVEVIDKQGKKYTTTFSPRAKGANMGADEASATLENSIAWSVVRSFTKE